MPDLSLQEGRDAIEGFVHDADLIVIDNILAYLEAATKTKLKAGKKPKNGL